MVKSISIIIPVKSDTENLPILKSLTNIQYPKDRLEVFLAIGKHPSVQRNKAAEIARGDILHFFNCGSRLTPDIFTRTIGLFNKDESIAGMGGPDLTPQKNSWVQRLFGYAMSSYFAHWKMRARYSQVGKERVAGEKELLLSNLAMRRDAYSKAKGFNERLWPNEENELINRMSGSGYKFIYNPDVKVYRDRRRSIFEFAKQFYKYGKGRMSQIFIEGWLHNLEFVVPVLLLAYFLILPFAGRYRFSFVPLAAYISLAFLDAAYLSFKNKRILTLLLPALYVIMHISYGLGMLKSLFERFIPARSDESSEKVVIKKVTI